MYSDSKITFCSNNYSTKSSIIAALTCQEAASLISCIICWDAASACIGQQFQQIIKRFASQIATKFADLFVTSPRVLGSRDQFFATDWNCRINLYVQTYCKILVFKLNALTKDLCFYIKVFDVGEQQTKLLIFKVSLVNLIMILESIWSDIFDLIWFCHKYVWICLYDGNWTTIC